MEEKNCMNELNIKSGLDNFFMISDIHLGIKNGSEQWQNNISGFFYDWFIPLLKNEKNERSFLIVLGDVFDDRKVTNIAVNDLTINIFTELGKLMPVFILNGNHDIYHKTDNSITSLKSLENIKGIKIFKKPTRINITNGNKKSVLCLIPYQGDHEKETKLCEENASADYIFMHTDIQGMKYDNGREINLAVNVESVKGRIYSGHIHKRQRNNNITYIGSPYQMRRSDIGNVKGIYRIDLKTDTESFFENNYSPVFQHFLLDEFLNMPYKDVKKICSNNYTDIFIYEDELSNVSITKLYDALEPCNPKRIEIKVLSKDLTSLNEDEDVAVTEKSIPEIITSLIDNMDIENDKKARLKTLSDKYQQLIQNEEE